VLQIYQLFKGMTRTERSQKKTILPLSERAAATPEEFAAAFGRGKIWTYRCVYAGRVKAIRDYGRLMIPTSEISRILASAK